MESLERVDRTWLKDLRKEKKLTVRETAKKLDMSASYYSDIENGRRNPSIHKSYMMANFFDLDVTIFFTDRVKFTEKTS